MIGRKLSKTLLAAVAAIMLLAVLATSAFAWSPGVEGEHVLTPDCATGYYLWHDDNGIHLRTHGPGEDHSFTARLHTDGVFVDVDSVRLESRDNFAVLDGGHTILMRFHTYDAIDGLNFRINGGTRLRLSLGLDGEPISTDNIFLGPNGKHPASNPFTLYR